MFSSYRPIHSPVCGLILLAGMSSVNADVIPSTMFGDHMVLQRNTEVPVWGTANPSEKVTVKFADKQTTTQADTNGKWMVKLPQLKASADGRELVIEGSNTITYKDVLVGEVWICAGQSNMQYGWGTQSQKRYNWGGDKDIAALAADAKTRPIRCYDVPVGISFTPNDNCKGKWSTDLSGSAVAFGFGYQLQKALNVPVAVIVSCWGSSSIEGWMPRDLTAKLPHFKTIMDQFDANASAHERIEKAQAMGIRDGMVFVRKQPNILYNAMLHPIIPYGCRGIVWYQGQANWDKPAEYAQSLPAWITFLRQKWDREDLHLLVVMLPGFGVDNGHPDAKSWAPFRNAQLQVLKIPHTSVVNTIDLGEAKNVHPADKLPVTERLVLLARHDVYNEAIIAQGPMFKNFRISGDKMIITFDHADGLTTTDGEPPREFWLAGKEGNWQLATAIINKNSIILTNEAIKNPVSCRYAYSGKPNVNLTNQAGMPCYPFKTD